MFSHCQQAATGSHKKHQGDYVHLHKWPITLIGTWASITSHTSGTRSCKTHHLFNLNKPSFTSHLHRPPHPFPTNYSGGMHIFLVSILMLGCLNFTPTISYTSPHTPNTQNTPTPYSPVPVVASLVSTHIYLGSSTFSLRPDEAAAQYRGSESLS